MNEFGIPVGERIAVPGEATPSKRVLNALTEGKNGFVVIAWPEVVKTMRNLIVMDRFSYGFTSFALARLAGK